MRTLYIEVHEARALEEKANSGDTTFVEVALRLPGQRRVVKRSTSVRELINPSWEDASFDFDVNKGGAEGEIEIRVCQGAKPDGVVVGETSIELRKLSSNGFERKPVRLDQRKGIIRVTASLKQGQSRKNNDDGGNRGRMKGREPQLEEGMKVDAMYRGGRKSYPGTIMIVNGDGTCDIDYDDGDKEASVKPNLIISMASPSKSPRRVNRSPDPDGRRASDGKELEEGMQIEARYKGRSRYYTGKVHKILRDGSCDIHYDDGEKERMVDPSLIRVLDYRGQQHRRDDSYSLKEGMRVEARYRERSRYYPGRISRVHRGGACDVDYDDGEKESMVDPSYIKVSESDSLSDSDDKNGLPRRDRDFEHHEGRALKEGVRVEARYKGRSRYYPGRVTRIHGDGSCDISYDDGETERLVEPSLIKVTDHPRTSRTDREGKDQLQEGMKVEARYKGRSRYCPGVLSRVRFDGSCDIEYDDGEQECIVDPSLVRVLRSRSSKSPTRGEHDHCKERNGARETAADDKDFREGLRVEARYKGRSIYNPGRIIKVHRNGSCDIDYDDGVTEYMVNPSLVRVFGEDTAHSEADPRSTQLREGARVEARYNGRSRFHPGRISRLHRDGACDINYDNGEEERMVKPYLVKLIGRDEHADIDRADEKLQENMKVEARYKGRSQYYPGKISRIHRNGTCDIDYDDGEKESMVEPSLVRGIGRRKWGVAPPVDDRLREGMKIEARYRGRSRYYPGRISRVYQNGTCDIDYDDGEHERMVERSLVRVVERGGNEGSGAAHSRLKEGMKIEAQYKGRSRFYPGRISRVHRDGTCDIDYDDGEQERMVEPTLVRVVEMGGNEGSGIARSSLREGMKIEARYRGRSRYYPGRISRVHRNGTCDIDYDDGEQERMVETSHIKIPVSGVEEGIDNTDDILREGMRMEARYRGRSRYYPGRISRVHRDGTCDIDYDDGEQERMVEPSLIKSVGLRFASPVKNSSFRRGSDVEQRKHESSSTRIKEGARVEARYKGRSLFYSGKVSRVHSDGSCDIDYDDGEKEHMVDPSLIRVIEDHRPRSPRESAKNSEKFKKGQSVEARYHGRGRFLPGKISRVRRDRTCDIDYDDGETEREVDASLIKPRLPPSDSPSHSSSSGNKLKEGSRIEARFKGRPRYYPGTVTRVHLNGSVDIDYDDGEQERTVEPSLVRLLDPPGMAHKRGGEADRSRGSGRDKHGSNSEGLEEGMKVEARYKGRTHYSSGKISRVYRDGFCDIHYDSGEKERTVDPSLMRKAESAHSSSLERRRHSTESILEGDAVEANYRGKGKYYPGRVAFVRSDGTFDIDYEDGDKETRVAAVDVRLAAGGGRSRADSIRRDRMKHRRSSDKEEESSRRPTRSRSRGRDRDVDGDVQLGRRRSRSAVSRSGVGGGDTRWRRGGRTSRSSSSSRGSKSEDSRDMGGGRRNGDKSQDSRGRSSIRNVNFAKQRRRDRTGGVGASSSPDDGNNFGQGSRVEACWHRASPYSRPRRTSKWEDGRVLASHGDGTFTVKYSSGHTEEDVPKACVRAAAGVRLGSGNNRSPPRENAKRTARDGRRNQSVWQIVERMADGLWWKSGAAWSKRVPLSSLEGEKNEKAKAELLLGRSESARFRRAFERAGATQDGGLTAAEAVRACRDLGGRTTETEVRDFLRTLESGSMNSHLDFPDFVKAYAWIFFRRAESGDECSYSSGGTSSDAKASLEEGGARDREAFRGRESHRRRQPEDQASARRVGYGARSSRRGDGKAGRRRSRGGNEVGVRIGEEAEVRRWEKRLGKEQMRRLERTFDSWADEAGGEGGRSGVVEAQDLEACFGEMGKRVDKRELKAWCENADLVPEDGLSLADFAYAFHAMFVDAGEDPLGSAGAPSPFSRTSRGPAPEAGNGLVLSSAGAGRRPDGGLRSVAEVSAAVFQEEKWEGTPEQHKALIRRVSVGRSSQQASMLNRAREVFEELDEDRDGEIPRQLVAKLLARVGRDPKTCSNQIADFCNGAVSPASGDGGGGFNGDEAQDTRGKRRRRARRRGRARDADRRSTGERRTVPSTTSLAECLATFGFVFEGTGQAVKPSVAEAFAMLRLHAQPAEARVAGETTRRYVDNVLSAPGDARFWRINSTNDAFFTKIGRHKGGRELLAAVGFCDELRAEAGRQESHAAKWRVKGAKDPSAPLGVEAGNGLSSPVHQEECKRWLVLEGTVGRDGKPISVVREEQLKVLRAARDEMDAELLALEGALSVSAALRALRESPESDTPALASAVRAAAEILLAYVVNALRNPRDPRVHRIRAGNPAFQRALGKLGGCEGAMTAVGFEPQDRGTIFVLRGGAGTVSKGQSEVGTAHFRFPGLNSITEAFLWRRKADLEAAIEAMPVTTITASAEASQRARGRVKEDLNDARTLAGGHFVGGVEADGVKMKGGKAAAESTPRASNRTEDEKHCSGDTTRDGKPRRSGGRTRSNRAASVGSAAPGALLAASGGSAATAGARGLQLAMIKESFARLDLDGDGFITPNDLRSAFRNKGRDASDRSVYAWIRRRDIQQDGRVSLDEFVASFQALMPPETAGWAAAAAGRGDAKQTSRANDIRGAPETDSDTKDIANDDGTSDVAAAFGRIRLSGSPSECRAAAEYVLEYCRRVRDSPSALLHWRIPLASKRFASTVGRLTGGIELMKAIGLRLEENGTALALREDGCASGAKWNYVPGSVLKRLDIAAKELTAQMRGIDHPEVADLAAVSTAVARLRDHKGNAGPHLLCIETAVKYLGNILEHPSMGKYRCINTSNPVFLRNVVSVQGGMQLVVALGFREDAYGQLVLPMDTDLTHLAARKLELDSGLHFLRTAAAAVECETNTPDGGTASKAQPGAGSAEGRQGRKASSTGGTVAGTSGSRQGGETPGAKVRMLTGRANVASRIIPPEGDRKSLARRKSESPERSTVAEARRVHESLEAEACSRRAAEAALLKREREIEKLRREIADHKEKEASTLPVRDAMTIARMDDEGRASVARLGSEMELDMTNPVEALAWAETVNKGRTLTAPSKIAPGANVSRAAVPTRGKGQSGLLKHARSLAATRLVAAATAGHAVLEVARTEIFHAGYKIVLGSGVGQEERFVSAVVGSAEEEDDETGRAYGGSIVLETSVARDHPEGERALPVRPGRAEAENYKKRQVVSMVRNLVLGPIIDTAASLGEQVLRARAAQSAFERRSVPKYSFIVAPASVGGIPSIDGVADNGHTSRGLAVLPELGKVVSVAGKSTLVCHQETLSLIYLRRSFLAVGRSAIGGKITAQEFRAELRSNPILAAGLSCTYGGQVAEGDPGDRALREIYRRRRGARGDARSCNDAQEAGRHAVANPLEMLTWSEFVGTFLPLGQWEWGGGAAGHRGEAREEHGEHPFCNGGWEAGLLPDANDDEMELLRVAFAVRASSVRGRDAPGVATLAELKAASAELDGEEPPEEPVRKAIKIGSNGNVNEHRQEENETRDKDGYSFRDFVLLRAVLARDAISGGGGDCGGGPGFASGWRLSALMHLRRVFVKVFDASFVSDDESDQEPGVAGASVGHQLLRSRHSPPPIEPTAEINAKDFVSEAFAEPEVVRFLGMHTAGAGRLLPASNESRGLKLRMALYKLVTDVDAKASPRDERDERLTVARRRQGDWNFVRWEDVEGLLFDPLDPATEVLSSPPLTASAASSMSLPAETAEEEVVELATDEEAGGVIYALMADGEVKVYDAAGPIGSGRGGDPGCEIGGPLWTCQLITNEPSPRALGSEGRREYTRCHEAVDPDEVSTIPKMEGRKHAADSARDPCKDGARRLLRLRPHARILYPCPGTGVLLVNSTAGDRCVRFHETAALRRICRTRLDLPPPPRSALTQGQGLFDAMAVSGAGLGRVATGSRVGGVVAENDRDEIGTTESSLVDLAFLAASSTLIGLIGGRPEVQAFCCDTGLVLAVFAGHALTVNCMLWIQSQLMLVTGSADGTGRVWDVGEDFMPHADEWARVKNSVTPKLRGDGARFGHCDAAPDIATLKNTVIGSVRGDNAPTPDEADDQCARDGSISGETSKRRLPIIARSLRAELLRQAGVRPVWRTARVTAVLDRTMAGATRAGSKMSGHQPLIEVTCDDGEVQHDVEAYRLRSLDEMHPRVRGSDDGQTNGPAWERQAVRPAVGVEVAVFGYSERRAYELVADILGRDTIRGWYPASQALNPAPLIQARLLARFKEARERATQAATSAGDESCADHLMSHTSLDAALDAAEVTDGDLHSLTAVLAEIWIASFFRIQSPPAATAGRRGRVAWAAVAQALVQPERFTATLQGSRGSETASTGGGQCQLQLRRWNSLRLPIPCKFLLSAGGGSNGGSTQVTSLGYLPLAMLLATGHSDGRVRLWDPCARRHRLAPPPPQYDAKRFTSSPDDGGEEGGDGRSGGSAHLHLRIWPEIYTDTAEEWTQTGQTFGCVAEFNAAASMTTTRLKAQARSRAGRGVGPGSSGTGRVRALNAIVIPGGGGPSLVVCDVEEAHVARVLDEEEPWDLASVGNDGGTFYLMHTGDVLALPSPRGFEECYVLLDDASFFEVSAPLGAQDHTEATRFREIFRARSGILRVLYTASVGRRAMEAIARRMNENGVAARTRRELDAHFPGRRFAVFYRDGDGPGRDITEEILSISTKNTASIAFDGGGGTSSARIYTAHSFISGDSCAAIVSGAVAPVGALSPSGSAEYLRVEVGGSGCRPNAPMAPTTVSAWTIGRVALGVEAGSFDEELGEDSQMEAEDAFMGAWALRMQHLRALCSMRLKAARDRASAEARVIAHMGGSLRLCSLDRACGKEAETSVGTTALVQAVETALRLPSRFPSGGAVDRRGVYFQAAKVMRYLILTEDGMRGGGVRGTRQIRELLDLLKRSATTPIDNLARHFLGAALTPTLERSIAGVSSASNGGDGRLFRWNGLRATLDATIDNDQTTTEEAFTLLVRLRQLSSGGVELETFAGRARELVRRSSGHLPANKIDQSAALNVLGRDNQNEASSSVLLWPRDIAALAAELDPLGKVDGAFAELRKTFGERQSASGQRSSSYRSPLHSYAVARRCRGWREHLAAMGDCLTVAKLKAGRRYQDLLLADSGHVIDSISFDSGPEPTVTAVKLVAEAKALMAKVARRQTAAAGSGDEYFQAILAARVHSYAPLPDRSTKDVRCYDGWGCYGQAVKLQRDNGTLRSKKGMVKDAYAGEPVAVLEISPGQARKTVNAVQGGTMSFGDNMAFIASLLSVPALRGQSGLIKFHPGARVLPDEKGTPLSGGDGDRAAGGSPVHIICERLQGWRSLREVISEHGPLVLSTCTDAAEESGGLRVLRLFGSQLTAVLECLRSRSLVLRDLRASTILVSPDGRNLKVVEFSSLATLEPMGTVSPGAASLDPEVHGPTRPLTPPEGLSSTVDSSLYAGKKKSSTLSSCTDRDIPLVLADSDRSGVFPATAAWDIWTLGVLLFELAFGHPPPAYGVALGQAITSSANPVVARDGAPAPKIEELARSVQYDFLSSIGESVARAKMQKYEDVSSTGFETVPALVNVLETMFVGAAIGASSPCSAPNVRRPPQGALAWQGGVTGQSKRIVERFQRAWVKQQLHMEERGDVEVSTWQEFREKIKRHLDVSIAVTPPIFGRSNFAPSSVLGGRHPRFVDIDIGETTANKGTAVSAVDRVMVRLREADAREHGWLPFRIVQRVLLNELQMSLSKSEAELLAVCLKEGAPSGRNYGKDVENCLNLVEDAVLYSTLEHILRTSVSSSDEVRAPHPRAQAPPPTAGSFIEVLCVCLEPDPVRRPSPSDLLRLPFFSWGEYDARDGEELDRASASAFLAGSSDGESPSLILRERVLRPVQAIEAAALGFPTGETKSGNGTAIMGPMPPPPGTRTGRSNASVRFNEGALMEALKDLQRLVRRGSCAFPGEDPLRERKAVHSHASVIDAIFESGVLLRVSAIALRLLEEEEANKTGRGVVGIGFVEGDPRKTVGARILLALAGVLEEFLRDLRRADSAIQPFTDVVLRCLVSLFLGEEGCIAVRYGRIGRSPLGAGPSTARFQATSAIGCEPELSHWRPTASQIFEGLLLEAVGETGEGGSAYPTIQRFLRRCQQETHFLAASDISGDGGDDSEDSNDSFRVGDDGDGEDNMYGGGGGGGQYGRIKDLEDDDSVEGWASSSEDGDSHGSRAHHCGEPLPHACHAARPRVGSGGRNLIRSRRPHRFFRAPLYFSELLALGRIICAIHRRPHNAGGGGSIGGSYRSRRKATAYCLTVVRMCCEIDCGGLNHAEPAGWVGCKRDLDEGAATLQRAQLLVDIRVAEKLAPCLHDTDSEIRSDAVYCALSALRGNHARLRWISTSAREGVVDPRALLALGFCTPVWVSGFGALIRDRSIPSRGSGSESRAARESGEKTRIAALGCLGYMAAAGELATHNWRGLRILSALQSVLGRDSAGTRATAVAENLGRSLPGSGRPKNQEFKGWREGVLEVLRSLVENGSVETHNMLRGQPTLVQEMKGRGLFSTEDLTPKGVAARGIELLAGGTLEELLSVIRRTRSMLATAVRTDNRGVLGSDDKVPRDVGVTMSLIWGWMQRVLVQLLRDESDHPSTEARVSIAWECLELMRFLLSSPSAAAHRLVLSEVHADLSEEVCRISGAPRAAGITGLRNDSLIHERDGPLKLQFATARTGLELLALLLSVEEPTPLDPYRAHPAPPLTYEAADILADALVCGDPAIIDYLEVCGLGLRLRLAVEASVKIVRHSRRLGVEDVHLLRTFPAGRRARVKLMDRILSRSHRGLQEQVIVSGLVKFVTGDMLPDCETTEFVNTRLPASFVRHNGTPLVRNEGIALMERVVARRRRSPAVAREMARQTVRLDLPAAECYRLRRFRLRSVRAGVGACLRCLVRLDSASVDNALVMSGVLRRALCSTRKDHAASKTRRQWARWLRREASRKSISSTVVGKPRLYPHDTTSNEATSSVSDVKKSSLLAQTVGDNRGGYVVGGSGNAPSSALRTSHNCEESTRPERGRGISTASIGQALLPRSTTTQSVSNGEDGLSPAAALKTAFDGEKRRALLTVEGALPTRSVSEVLELLAADLGSPSDAITVVKFSESFPTGERATGHSSSANDSAYTTVTVNVGLESTLEISLPEALANRLYTRCLAGVLRVPGLLFLKVEGKGKLTWNGEEIFSEDPLRRSGPVDSKPLVTPTPQGPFAQSPQETDVAQVSVPGEDDETVSRGAQISAASKRPRSRVRFSWQAPSATADTKFAQPMKAGKPSSEVQEESKSERHIRVATALDRMGAGIVEVREAFQRRVPLRRQATDAKQDPTRVGFAPISRHRGTRHDGRKESHSVTVDIEHAAYESGVEEAMVRAMIDLRMPVEIAKKCCNGGGATSVVKGPPTFSDFVERYARGAGLLKEPLDGKRGQLWVEGPGGMWVEVSLEELARARAAFDEQATTREEDTKSDEAWGLNLEDSIDKSEAILALKRLFPGAASAKAIETFLEKRGHILDELFVGRVSFQEFVRAVLHLSPASRLDGDTPPPRKSHQVPLSDTCVDPLHPLRDYFDGMPGRLLGKSRNSGQGSNQGRPEESKSRSPVAAGRDRRHDRTSEDTRTQGSRWSPRGLEAAAACLRLDRDSQEERRAWAQRAGAGRVPLDATRAGKSGRAAAAATTQSRAGAYSSDMRAGKESRHDKDSDGHNGRLRQARPRSADHATSPFAAGRSVRSTTSTGAEDPVSRAFEKYAMARNSDTDHQPLESRPTSSTRATETERGVQLGYYALPPGGWPRRQPPVPPSEATTRRPENGGVRELQSSERQRTGLTPNGPRKSDDRVSFHRRQDSTHRERKGGTEGFNSGDDRGGRGRLFGSTISAPRWRQRDRHNDSARQGANEEGNNRRVRETILEQGQDEAINEPEKQRALKRAFDAYDINGDGFITYLELKAVFEQRGVSTSDVEVRNWINQRDTSGTGAVDFEDFSRAFVFS